MQIKSFVLILLLLAATLGCSKKEQSTNSENSASEGSAAIESAPSDSGDASAVEQTAESETDSVASIGEATMEEDGTLVLQLRAEAPGGGSGDAMIQYKPNDPRYQRTLDHIGGLEPGQSKPVPPWPDQNADTE